MIQQIRYVLLVTLLGAAPVINAQTTDNNSSDSALKGETFAVNLFPAGKWKMNLILALRRSNRVTITLKDNRNATLYQESLKKDSRGYWRKFDFEGSEPGVYQFKVSDGQQTIIRQIVVVDIPAVEPQRFISYGLPIGL